METSELLDLRTAIVLESSIDPDQAAELKEKYERMAEEAIKRLRLDPNQLADAQIGLILMCASMKLHAGLTQDYDFELRQAYEYAYQRGDDTLAEQVSSLRLQ